MTAVLFGSISTVADTSELQREAFNRAFETHGLDWRWDREQYLDLIQTSGGQDRIAAYAADKGEQVDAAAVHATKSELFRESLKAAGLQPRPGVVETVQAARSAGVSVGLVTTTSPDNVEALLSALAPALGRKDFDIVVDLTDVDAPKPDGAAYAYALQQLAQGAEGVVAIEDNLGGVQAARAAGVPVIAFPNQNTAGHDFGEADRTVDHLDFAELDATYLKASA